MLVISYACIILATPPKLPAMVPQTALGAWPRTWGIQLVHDATLPLWRRVNLILGRRASFVVHFVEF